MLSHLWVFLCVIYPTTTQPFRPGDVLIHLVPKPHSYCMIALSVPYSTQIWFKIMSCIRYQVSFILHVE